MHGILRTTFALLSVPVATSVAFAQPPAGKPAAAPAAKPAAPPAAAPAAAPPAAPMTPPKPAPEFETFMKSTEGTWKCESTMPAGSMGPGSPEMKNKATIKIKKTLDGFGYEGEYDTKKTKEMPAMKGRFFLAWDSAGKQLVSALYDTMGGISQTAGPISGETATLTGTGSMMGQKMKVREVITTKPGGKELGHTFEADMGKGWMMMVKDDCKK